MKKRIVGIDVARALAIIGMIIVNFKTVFGSSGEGWLKHFAQVVDGKAAATFVVLAGVGLALMTNTAVLNNNFKKLQTAYKRIVKRAAFLFIVGISYIWIWPADILHFYGVYMLITLFFITRKPNQILIATAAIILTYPLLISIFNYEAGWNFSNLSYLDFWSVNGFFRNLFYNGFHPVAPWVAFMLFGLWFGKQDLNDDRFVRRSFWISLLAFIGIQLISAGFIMAFSTEEYQSNEEIRAIFGTSPMPPMPIYMFNGIAAAVCTISACIILAKRYPKNNIINALHKTGQLALTFYVAHVIIGMGLVDEFGGKDLGEYSINFSVCYALIFSLTCILFAFFWLKFKNIGPLEWIIRKITD